jgi:hypothetical protein
MTETRIPETIPDSILDQIDLRDVGTGAEGYIVRASELNSVGKGQDFHQAVLETPAGEFVQLFFLFIKAWDDQEVYGADVEGLAPKFVFPKAQVTIVYE